MKKRIINLLKLIVSLTLIYFLVKKIGLNELWSTVKSINISYLIMAFVFTVLSFMIQVNRLKILIKSQKIEISFRKLLEFNLISNFFGIFLPTVIGGDVVKMAFLGKHSGMKVKSAGIVLMDRIVGTYALVTVAFIASIFGRRYLTSQIFGYTLDIFILSFIFLIFLNLRPLWRFIWKLLLKSGFKFILVIKKFIETLQFYKLNDPSFIGGFVWSLVFYFSIILSNYFISLSLGLSINVAIFFVFVPLLSLAGMIPISISGLGVRESISVIFFSTLGIPANYGVLLSFLPFTFKIIMGFLGGIIYLKNEITLNK